MLGRSGGTSREGASTTSTTTPPWLLRCNGCGSPRKVVGMKLGVRYVKGTCLDGCHQVGDTAGRSDLGTRWGTVTEGGRLEAASRGEHWGAGRKDTPTRVQPEGGMQFWGALVEV